MSRKKATKKAKLKKTTAKSSTKGITLTETLETNFRELPTKLMTQCRKDLVGLKQRATSLQTTLNKAHKHKEIANKQLTGLIAKSTKTAATAKIKKQLNTQKQTLATHTATINDITKQLAQAQQLIATLNSKQSKYATLQKQLATLAKPWTIKAKTPKITKTGTKKRTKTPKDTITTTTTPVNNYGTITPTQGERTISSGTEIETLE